MASINILRNRLYLLAKLPPKDGSPGLKQYRIPLYLDDTPINQRTARKRLAELEKQLAAGTFAWSYWQREDTSGTCSWTEGIRRLYQKRVVLGKTSETTWQVNYLGRLRQIPGNQAITTTSIAQALSKYRRDQCSYKELYYLLKQIAALTEVPFPEVAVPTYDHRNTPEVPTDPEIVDWVQAASGPAAWYFGMMATYGLRPHEIEGSVLLDGDRLQVPDDTKTGFRTVIPLHREWVELFSLRERRPYTGRTQMNRWLWGEVRKLGLPWKPYALRHAYAARLWRMGGSELDLFTAARLMGHTVDQHARCYRAHIDPNSIAVAAEDAIARRLSKVNDQLSQVLHPNPAPPH